MRTTLTLDDDLAAMLEQRGQDLGIPFDEVVNRTLRSGLGATAKPRSGPQVKTIPHSFGFNPGIDLDRLNQLADELEADAFAAAPAKAEKCVGYSVR